MILSDKQIRERCRKDNMISPFEVGQVKRCGSRDIISYGCSSFGYDARIANEFKIFTNIHTATIDPKNFNEDSYVDIVGDEILLPPNSFLLSRTIEKFRIPRDVIAIGVSKSTYARCGISVNISPLESEWEGYVTIEVTNSTNLPVRIYANEGICQFLFFQGSEPCETSYADRGGKYQGQTGVTITRV